MRTTQHATSHHRPEFKSPLRHAGFRGKAQAKALRFLPPGPDGPRGHSLVKRAGRWLVSSLRLVEARRPTASEVSTK